MKKILLGIATLAMCANGFAQGLITYYNRGVVNATTSAAENIPILLAPSLRGTAGEGPGSRPGLYSIGLFLKTGTTYSLVTTPQAGVPSHLGAFRTSTNPGTPSDLTAYMVEGIGLVIPTVAAGSPATFQLRAWLTSSGSYDAATQRGSSADLVIAQLGGNPPGGAPSIATPSLSNTGLASFTVTPEPSTYALGIAGLGALAFLRRRK